MKEEQQVFELTYTKNGVKYYLDHICICGCKRNIKVKSWHKWSGIPKYFSYHNPTVLPDLRKRVEEFDAAEKVVIGGIEYYKDKYCLCFHNCGERIQVKPHHEYSGIPKCISSHRVTTNKGVTKKENPNLTHIVSEETKEIMRAVKEGEKHPFWIGGRSFFPYPSNFTYKLKETIRERDGNVCQLCGKTKEENGKNLAVHHIDYIKEHTFPENLISLCSSCSTKVNGNREYWINFFQQRLRLRKVG